MKKLDVINYLRGSVIGTEPNIIYDREFNPSDENLGNVVNMVLLSLDPNTDLNDIEEELLQPLVLQCKKDLFLQLATKAAPLYNISTDEVKINKGDRFSHYMKLAQYMQEELAEYEKSGGSFKVQSHEATISGRYFSKRNYELAHIPIVTTTMDLVTKDSVSIHWKLRNNTLFAKYEIYYMKLDQNTPYIIDAYNNNSITDHAFKLEEIKDFHINKCRIMNLDEDSDYVIAVLAYERNGLFGYSEINIKTLKDVTIDPPIEPPVDPSIPDTGEGSKPDEGNDYIPPNNIPNVDELNPVDKDYIYNGYDVKSIQDEITKALEEVGKEIDFMRQVDADEEDVFGEVEEDHKAYSPLFRVTGIFTSNPEKEQLSMYGYDHNANAIFSVSCEQIETYAKAIYPEDKELVPLVQNNKHSVITHSGLELIKLTDSIMLDGLTYNIINIRPHATYIGKVLMYSFECISEIK